MHTHTVIEKYVGKTIKIKKIQIKAAPKTGNNSNCNYIKMPN